MADKKPAQVQTRGGLRRELSALGKGSLTLLVPTVVTRGLSLILTPLYTRFMSAGDFGVVGLGTTLVPLLAMALGWGVHSGTYRLHHTYPDDESRRRLSGAGLGFLVTVPLALTLLVELAFAVGATSPIIGLPYSPYLRIVLWISLFSLYTGMGINMLVVREEHRRCAKLNATLALLTAGFTVLFVVVLRRGALGQLLAILLATGVTAVWSIAIAWQFGRPNLDVEFLGPLVSFSLPLVPHEFSKWGLAASDRLILDRYVSVADIGCYALGYTFGSAVGMLLSALNSAFFPIVHRKLASREGLDDVPVLGNVVVSVAATAALGASVVFPPFIKLVTPPAYHSAAHIVPWVAAGLFFQALYSVWSQATFFARRSGAVAFITILGAAINVALNFILVPRWGIIAAAVSTTIGYAFMAILHGVVAHRSYPIPWEYGRLVRISLSALAAYSCVRLVRFATPLLDLSVRSALVAVVFPAFLLLLGGLRGSDIARVRALRSRAQP